MDLLVICKICLDFYLSISELTTRSIIYIMPVGGILIDWWFLQRKRKFNLSQYLGIVFLKLTNFVYFYYFSNSWVRHEDLCITLRHFTRVQERFVRFFVYIFLFLPPGEIHYRPLRLLRYTLGMWEYYSLKPECSSAHHVEKGPNPLGAFRSPSRGGRLGPPQATKDFGNKKPRSNGRYPEIRGVP